MKKEEFISLEDQYGAHNYKPLPVVLAKGQGATVWDTDGNEYLDFLSAYSAVNQGHNHPEIVKALTDQAQQLSLTSRAFYNNKLGLCEWRLADLFEMDKVLMMNSGAEAVETAIKLARKWGYLKKGVPKDQAKIVVCDQNFHGRTISIISFSSDATSTEDFGPFTPGMISIPYGDIDALEKAMNDTNVVGFLFEPVQGEAGVIIPPDGYLSAARDLCTAKNVLFMADEIQTGLGRTGKRLAIDHEKVRADVLMLGKALSGGMYPVSAVLASEEVMSCIKPGQHGSTYGGNPLACAVTMAALNVFEKEDLAKRSRKMGELFRAGLRNAATPSVTSIRGKGLMCAIDVAPKNGQTAWELCLLLMQGGLLAKPTHDHTIRLTPPLTIGVDEINKACAIIQEALEAYENLI